MLDFYNGLSEAVKGRLQGAEALARVNDALKDILWALVMDTEPFNIGDGGVLVSPILNDEIEAAIRDEPELTHLRHVAAQLAAPEGSDPAYLEPGSVEPIRPPLRTLHAQPERNAPSRSRSDR